jgi:2-dehydro-3-deoxyphosphogluconate aldolase / (4S)-4-hydroxy-2-oxoglutarate aldolase
VTRRAATVHAIETCGVVGIIRMNDPAQLSEVVQALVEGGVRALEITITVPGALDLIRRTAASLPDGFLMGAGTVLDADSARRAVDAGAQFLVSPTLNLDVIAAGHHDDVPVLPGCFSPTEILAAWNAGADLVTLFPATALRPTYVRDVHGPLPHIKMVPTGGVSLENAAEWIRAGASALGVGSALLDADALAARDYGVIRDNAKHLVAAVSIARAGDA